jgi:hypothetical protein
VKAYYTAFQRLNSEGVVIDRYTMVDVVDDSKFHYEPMNFNPDQSAPEMAKKFVKRFALMGAGAFILVLGMVVLIIWVIKRKGRRRSKKTG